MRTVRFDSGAEAGGLMEQFTFVDGVDDDCVCIDRLLLDVSDEPAGLAW